MIAHVGTPHYRAALRHGAGLLSDGIEVTVGFKIGDIDPRGERADPLPSLTRRGRSAAPCWRP